MTTRNEELEDIAKQIKRCTQALRAMRGAEQPVRQRFYHSLDKQADRVLSLAHDELPDALA